MINDGRKVREKLRICTVETNNETVFQRAFYFTQNAIEEIAFPDASVAGYTDDPEAVSTWPQ